MIFPLKTARIIKKLAPELIWNMERNEKVIYLTFDDGPINLVTPFVLDELIKYNAKATFFCIGDNIRKHPDVFKRLIAEGHSIGNHTYNHLSGWKTDNQIYFDNILKSETLIPGESNLFRPPYGRISRSQIKYLKEFYKIIMWDVLSGDFQKSLNPEKCLKGCISKTESGTIIVFHDSIKAFPVLSKVLPSYLDHFHKRGFIFKSL
jgi:peptidoglycan-N-acetylglucosamine deacetylase